MKKGLLALGALFAICLSMLATDMVVKQKNGEDWKINVDDVEEVFFEEKANIPDDSTVIDASETFLLFNILSDSTVELTRETPNLKEDSYFGHDSIIVPQKIRIDGKIYTVTSIGDSAFYRCTSLANIKIPESVTSIGKSAFYNCTKLMEINIPSSSVNIGEDAFKHCSNLRVIIDNSKDNVKVGTDAFYDCASVTFLKELITLLDSTTTNLKFRILTDSTVEVIRDRSYNFMLNIYIPSMVQAIDSSIYRVTSIGASVFYGCILTSINIPEGISNIGENAFRNCSKLTNIEIPCSVTDIEGQAFENCEKLDVVIDNSEKNVKVGADAFRNCKSVTWLKD